METHSWILLAITIHSCLAATENSYGSEFVVGILPYVADSLEFLEIRVHVTNHENHAVEANMVFPSENASINASKSISAHSTWIYVLNNNPAWSPAGENKGFRVWTDPGETVGVTVSLRETQSGGEGTYRVLPYDNGQADVELYEYLVPYGSSISSVLLVAGQNQTNVSLSSPLPLFIPDYLSPTGNNETLVAANITLHQYQTFLLRTESTDYSFINITADLPIVLFFGNPSAPVTDQNGQKYSEDFMGGQMPPTITWGQIFFTQIFPSDSATVVCLASSNDTLLEYQCAGVPSFTSTLAAGQVESIALTSGQSCSAVSSKPVVIMLISSLAEDSTFIGGRSLTVLPPVEQFLERVIFPPISNFDVGQCVFTGMCDDAVAVLATVGINSNIPQVLLDGNSVSEDAWTTVNFPNGSILGFVTIQMFDDSFHAIQSNSSDTRISAIVHRTAYLKAISFVAGMNLLPLQAPPGLSSPNIAPDVGASALGPYRILVAILSFPLSAEFGELIGYNISYNSSTAQMSLLIPSTSYIVTYILIDLQPLTLYTIQVAIVTTGGQGPSGVFSVMTESGVPSEPINASYVSTNSTSILISWSPPLVPNGVIINYIVVVTEVETGVTQASNTTNTAMLVTNLKPNTAYSVTVFAETVAGVGNSSELLAVFIHLYVPIEIVDDPVETTHFAGGNISLSCSASGIPPPAFAWYKNGVQISEDGRVTMFNTTVTDTPNEVIIQNTLSFSNLMVSDDADYFCEATNPGVNDTTIFTVSSTSAHLNVQYPPNVSAIEPVELIVNHTQVAEFACEAFGIPVPNITWVKVSDGSVLSSSTSDIEITEVIMGDSSTRISNLTFLNTTRTDQSEYTCVGSNGITNVIDSPESDTINLLVQEYCYNTGAISQNDNSVVTACDSGYTINVCYPQNYDVAYSLATAACNSKQLEYDSFSFGYTSSSGLVPHTCPYYVSYIYECDFTYVDSCQPLITYCREPVECYGYSYRLANQSTYYDDGNEYNIGTLEICINGTYYPSCLDSLPQGVCSNIYLFNPVTLEYPLVDTDCYNVTSSDQLYVANPGCYDNCTLVSSCSTPLNEITCMIPPYMYTCYDGPVRLSHGSSSIYPNGYYESTGRVEVCVNGEYIDVCPGSVDVQQVCSYFGYSVGQQVPYESQYNSSGTGLFADFSCSSDYEPLLPCYNMTISCTSDPLVVYCVQECEDWTSRLVNISVSTTSNDYNTVVNNAITGLIEVCIDGSWLTVCYDGPDQLTEDNRRAVNLTCQRMGYDGGEVVNGIASNSNSQILYNISCPEYAYSLYHCSYSEMPPSVCLSHQMDAVVVCYDDDYYCSSYDGPSAYHYYSNGSYAKTRYGQLCINNTLHAVCSSGLDEEDIQTFCSYLLGAQYGYIVQSQDIEDRFYPPITKNGISNINCSGSYGYFDPYYCSYSVSYDHCESNGGPALVTCIFVASPYICSDEEVIMTDLNGGYFCDGSDVFTGVFSVCVNGGYVPVCSSALSSQDAQGYCQYYYGSNAVALLGPVEGLPYTSGGSSEKVGVVTNLTCTYDYYCHVDEVIESSCDSFGGIAVITCLIQYIPPVPCYDGDVRLVYTSNYTQQYSPTSYAEVTSGYLEVCYEGSWISVCLNDTSDSQIAELACRNIIGYSDYSNITAQTNYYYTTFEYSAINFNCSDYFYYLSECSFATTSDYVCQSHQYDAYLTCSIGIGMLHFLSQPMDTIGVAGNLTSLHCNVSGHPISSLLWYKNDVLILDGSEQLPNRITDENKREVPPGIFITESVGFGYWSSILTITKLNVTDNGTYHCQATQQDELVITSNKAWLFVQYPPKLIQGFASAIRNQSDSVTFRCLFVGVPAPFIDWYIQDVSEINNGLLTRKRDTANGAYGMLIGANSRVSIESTTRRAGNLEESESILTIKSLMRSSDEGQYTCKGRNEVANLIDTVTSSSATLTVYVPPNIQPASGLTSQIAVKDDDYVIEFTITDAYPMVDIGNIHWWYQDDLSSTPQYLLPSIGKRQQEEQPRRLLSDDRKSLTINDVQISDGGYYTITATNLAGVRNKTISLTVHVKPELQNYSGSHVVLEESKQAVFNCSADGIPAPDIVWRRGGQLLREVENKFRITNTGSNAFRSQEQLPGLMGTTSMLTVLSLTATDSATYSCRANNGAGPGVVMQNPYTLEVISVNPDPQPCESDPCKNDGVCSEHGEEYVCQCAEGFDGKNCEEVVSIEVPPMIIEPPVDTFGQLFGKAALNCIATGNPNPNIWWYKDNRRYSNAIADTPILEFQELSLKNRGFYYCEAFNLQGGRRVSVISKTVVLNIEDVVQYEAEILLPEDFYNTNKEKRQSINDDIKDNIDSLIAEMNMFLSGSQLSENSSFFFVELQNPESINFAVIPEALPVVFTLVTKQEVGDILRNEVEEELMNVGDQLSVVIVIEDVERFDGCQENSTVIPSHSGNPDLTITIPWPETNIGVTAYVNCPCGTLSIGAGEELRASRVCGGDFTNGAKWEEPYVAPCNFSDLARSICQIASLDSAEERVEELELITENPDNLGSVEVAASVSVLLTTTDEVGGNRTLTEEFFDVVDNILNVSPETLQESQSSANSSAMLLESIEMVTADIPIPVNQTEPVILAQESFAVSVQQVNPEEFEMQIFSVSLGDDPFSGMAQLNNNSLGLSPGASFTASVSLPENLFDSLTMSNSSRIAHSVFLNDALYLRRNNSGLEVGSIIIAASIVNSTVEQLNPPVSITFLKDLTVENGSNPLCTFWNPQLDDGFGDWSSEGCERDESYNELDEFVQCHCDHLTSFSILLDVSPNITSTETDSVDVFLSAVTYIGCILSIFCLLLTISTYVSSKKLRLSEHGQLLLNLCFALLGLYVSFILAIHSTAVTGLCMLVAALLQYFFLVSFMAMGVEAINLYMKLVVVLGSKISHYALKAVVVCWVTPIFIVLFTFAPKPDAYANDHFCRAVGIPFYVGMIAPFILIYLFNWTVFLIIMISIVCKNCPKHSSKSAAHSQKTGMSPRKQFMIAMMLSVLFGIGWGIGLLATRELTNVIVRDLFASLFVIVTSFHGLLIFILHCVRSKEARKEWRRWFFKATKKDLSELTSSTFGPTHHRQKTSSSQAPYQSSTSRSTGKTDLSLSATSPCTSMMHDPGTLKFNIMKHQGHSDDFNLGTMNDDGYDKELEADAETEFTKVDLAKLEAHPVSALPVTCATTSSDPADDAILQDPADVMVSGSGSGRDEPKLDKQALEEMKTEKKEDIQLDTQDETERNQQEAVHPVGADK